MGKRHIEAVVWTALPPKFNERNGYAATAGEVVARLDGLEAEERKAAEEYLRRTPSHIDTPYRRLIEAQLGWTARRDAHVKRMR
jgi:hypothetical protein